MKFKKDIYIGPSSSDYWLYYVCPNCYRRHVSSTVYCSSKCVKEYTIKKEKEENETNNNIRK